MGYPDLKSDESIVLTAQLVKVKSVPFELVLTNRRLIIIDSEKNAVPTQQIPLVTIRNVMAGENAIRDPVITLTVLTDTADTREVALTFARQTPGERRREADEWVKVLKRYVADTVSHPADMVTDTQVPGNTRQDHTGTSGIKKKIEISRPIKKITVDTSHLPPKPVETTSLPEGSFCGRCGNRIPPGSTFCNRCGTKVVVPGDDMAVSAAPGQITMAPAVASGPGDRKGRPIEQIIHSIEPLIEDSVPRTEAAPAVPEPAAAQPAEPVPAPATRQMSLQPRLQLSQEWDRMHCQHRRQGRCSASPGAFSTPEEKEEDPCCCNYYCRHPPRCGRGICSDEHPAQDRGRDTGRYPRSDHRDTHADCNAHRSAYHGRDDAAVTTTPQVLIPQTGVWVEITYNKTYSGLVGTPGMQQGVSDTGDHFYRIPTTVGTVAVAIQKTDGSGDELKVIVYNNGITAKTVSTTTPYGNIDLQYSLATPTPTPTPVLTPLPTLPLSSNATNTVNTTNSTA